MPGSQSHIAAAAVAAAGSMQVLTQAFLQQPAAVAAALEVAHRSNPLLKFLSMR
jgi:hypothetical protein